MFAIISEKSNCVYFEIPARFDRHHANRRVKLRVAGRSRNANYTFDEETPIYMRKEQRITFIQTDKPKYKPGQEG